MSKFLQFFIISTATFLVSLSPIFAASNLPVPPDSEEKKAEIRKLGNSDYNFTFYTSSAGINQIKNFYRQELPKSGWKERRILNELKSKGLKIDPSLGNTLEQSLIFEKDADMLIINFLPTEPSAKGEARFTLFQGKSVLTGEGREATTPIPALVAKPQKDVFPVYPEASLVTLDEPSGAIKAAYLAKDNIAAVAEFYKVKMPNYGWSLVEEKSPEQVDMPAMSREDIAKYCPTCAANTAIPPSSIEVWAAHLYFTNQNQDTCNLNLSQVIISKDMPKTETTSIWVDYEEKK